MVIANRFPQPRSGSFLGQLEFAEVAVDGTWLEPDCLCYPQGGMNRRAFARCEDGVCRIIECGLPDAFQAIHGRTSMWGRYAKGYIYRDKNGFRFLRHHYMPAEATPLR
jgi:hypothetical protein